MVFITGGTGFIGTHLVNSLQKDKRGIYLLTRNDVYEPGSNKKIIKIKGDINKIKDIPEDVNIIYHCAGVISDEARMWEVNVAGTERIAELAFRQKIPLVHLSSAGVVGNTKDKVIDEETRPEPVALYEKTKLEAEHILKKYISKGLNAIILRPTIVFGTGRNLKEDSFFHLISAIIKGRYFHIDCGTGIYNIVHVNEVVRAMRILGESDRFYGQIYFLNTPISFFDFVETTFKTVYDRKPAFNNIPLYIAYPFALCFSLIAASTGRKMPFSLSRLKALTNKKIINSNKITTKTPFRFEKDVREYIQDMVIFYMQNGLIKT